MAAKKKRRRRRYLPTITRTTTTSSDIESEAGTSGDAGFTVLEVVLGVAVLGGLAYLIYNATSSTTTTTSSSSTSSGPQTQNA